MTKVGQITKAFTSKLIFGEPKYKHHFMICVNHRLYYYICSKKRREDYPITHNDCPKLPNDISYISLSRYYHVSDDEFKKMKSEHTCTVTDEFLSRFTEHVRNTPVLNERERKIVISGLTNK